MPLQQGRDRASVCRWQRALPQLLHWRHGKSRAGVVLAEEMRVSVGELTAVAAGSMSGAVAWMTRRLKTMLMRTARGV